MADKKYPTPARLWWMRVVAWARRNPGARADVLELSAEALRARADKLQVKDKGAIRQRLFRSTADKFEQRAGEIRPRA
jgi:hypothetical protein